jgi:hypothetical protein
MIRLLLASLLIASAMGAAAAQAPDTCASKAVGKDGKELHGAARTSFMAKCKREALVWWVSTGRAMGCGLSNSAGCFAKAVRIGAANK